MPTDATCEIEILSSLEPMSLGLMRDTRCGVTSIRSGNQSAPWDRLPELPADRCTDSGHTRRSVRGACAKIRAIASPRPVMIAKRRTRLCLPCPTAKSRSHQCSAGRHIFECVRTPLGQETLALLRTGNQADGRIGREPATVFGDEFINSVQDERGAERPKNC
jgi:hypothetical protein